MIPINQLAKAISALDGNELAQLEELISAYRELYNATRRRDGAITKAKAKLDELDPPQQGV